MKKGLLFCCCLFIYINLLAQGTETGCLLPNNIVYTEISSSGLYKFDSDAGVVSLNSNYCSWTPSSGISCTVCIGGNGRYNMGGNCTGMGKSPVSGQYGTFTMVLCPLDDYIPVFLTIICGMGCFYLRRNNKLVVY